MGINFGSGHTNAGSSTFSFDFTYTVNPDRTWTSDMVPGSFLGTETSGGRSGQTFTIDQLPTFYGHISQDGKTLTAATVHSADGVVLANPAPTQEKTTYSDGSTDYRICQRSRTFIAYRDVGEDDRGD